MFVQWLDEDGAEAEDAAEDGDEDGGALGDDHHTPKTTFHLLFTVFVQDASFSVIFFFPPPDSLICTLKCSLMRSC